MKTTAVIKKYPVAYDSTEDPPKIVGLLPAGKQAYVFDKEEEKWFLATSDGTNWLFEFDEKE